MIGKKQIPIYRVVMITGDNGITASSIARQINMPNCDKIITGDELNKMSEEELRNRVKDVSIFSRVIPEHKMRIVRAFQENGEVVAMTGDVDCEFRNNSRSDANVIFAVKWIFEAGTTITKSVIVSSWNSSGSSYLV